MAVWWVDPYADANIGGIHGTVDITTRNGTYAYPFKLSDVTTTSTTGLSTSINGQAISDGDEFRFKGLSSREDFLVDLGNTWYNQYGYQQLNTNTSPTEISNLASSWPSTAGTWGSQNTFVMDPQDTDKYTIQSAGNFKPLVSYKFNRSNNYTFNMSYSYNIGFNRYALTSQYPNSGYATQRWYALDPDYAVPYSSTTCYLLNLTRAITVTDGWTSETTRNGYNFIRMITNGTGSHYFYMNIPGNSNSNSCALFDMPDTGWDFHHSSATGPANCYYRVSSATATTVGGSAYTGYSYTQKPGALYGSNTYSSYIWDFTGNYYKTSAYQATSCNSIDLTAGFGTFFESAGRYASSSTASYPTRTYRNIIIAYYGYLNSSYGYSAYYNLGSMYTNSNTSGGMMQVGYSPGSSGWLKLIDGSQYHSTNSSTVSLFNGGGTGLLNNTFVDSVDAFANTVYSESTHVDNPSGIIYNYSNDSSSGWPSSTYVYGKPVAIKSGGGEPGLKGKHKYAATDWWTGAYIKGGDVDNVSTSGAYVLSQSMGVLDTEGNDYTTTDCTVLIETDAVMYASSSSYLQYPSFHYSRNTYDGKPITLLPSTDDGGANTACIGYNNDSNAFCVQSNPNDNNDYFGKDFEIVLPTYDPSTQNIRIDCTYRHEVLNGNGLGSYSTMFYYYLNASGGLSLSSVNLLSSNTSDTTVQTTISGSNMAQGNNKLNHIIGRLRFYNSVGNASTPDRGRLVIKSLTATTV